MNNSVDHRDDKENDDIKLIESTPETKHILHKYQSPLRWLILLFSSLLLCGDYYSYDTPYACKRLLAERLGYNDDEEDQENKQYQEFQYLFNLLYSVYQFPNIFLPFINGFITDKVIFFNQHHIYIL